MHQFVACLVPSMFTRLYQSLAVGDHVGPCDDHVTASSDDTCNLATLVLTYKTSCWSNGRPVMSVEVKFRVRTGDTVYGEAPGCGSGSLDVSIQLSLVGSIPELGAWCLSRRIPVLQKAEQGARFETLAVSVASMSSW